MATPLGNALAGDQKKRPRYKARQAGASLPSEAMTPLQQAAMQPASAASASPPRLSGIHDTTMARPGQYAGVQPRSTGLATPGMFAGMPTRELHDANAPMNRGASVGPQSPGVDSRLQMALSGERSPAPGIVTRGGVTSVVGQQTNLADDTPQNVPPSMLAYNRARGPVSAETAVNEDGQERFRRSVSPSGQVSVVGAPTTSYAEWTNMGRPEGFAVVNPPNNLSQAMDNAPNIGPVRDGKRISNFEASRREMVDAEGQPTERRALNDAYHARRDERRSEAREMRTENAQFRDALRGRSPMRDADGNPDMMGSLAAMMAGRGGVPGAAMAMQGMATGGANASESMLNQARAQSEMAKAMGIQQALSPEGQMRDMVNAAMSNPELMNSSPQIRSMVTNYLQSGLGGGAQAGPEGPSVDPSVTAANLNFDPGTATDTDKDRFIRAIAENTPPDQLGAVLAQHGIPESELKAWVSRNRPGITDDIGDFFSGGLARMTGRGDEAYQDFAEENEFWNQMNTATGRPPRKPFGWSLLKPYMSLMQAIQGGGSSGGGGSPQAMFRG